MTRPVQLDLIDITKRYQDRPVLTGVNFTARAPGIVALVGENGVGKSTLLQIVAGILAPDTGSVLLDGARLAPQGGEARRALGYVPEATGVLPHLTVRELARLTASLKRCALPAGELAQRLGVEPLWDQRIGSLSLGQRRRALLLAGLIGDPRLVLLDEPTNGLDVGGVEMLASLLLDRATAGALVVVATHDRPFAACLSPRLVELRDGGFVADTPVGASITGED